MALTPEQAEKNRLCLSCHDGDNSPHFEFGTFYGQIAHKGLDEYKDPKVHHGITPRLARSATAGAARARRPSRSARTTNPRFLPVTPGVLTMSVKRRLASCGLGLAVFLVLIARLPGMFRIVEVEQVPVERLVTNLEAAVKKDPKDVQALVNLARVHGMAFALKTDTAEVRKGQEEKGPWFGYKPKFVPFSEVEKTDDAGKQKAAKVHLAKAIEPLQAGGEAGAGQPAGPAGLRLDPGAVRREDRRHQGVPLADRGRLEEGEGPQVAAPERAHHRHGGVGLPDPAARHGEGQGGDRHADRAGRAKLSKLPRPITPIAVPLRDGLRAATSRTGMPRSPSTPTARG